MTRFSWFVLLIAPSFALPGCAPPKTRGAPPTAEGALIGDFALTERSGRTVHAGDLKGKVLIVSFIFTRCTGGCPAVTNTQRDLQDRFRDLPDVRLVTITVDPAHDDLAQLRAYADQYGADPDRWLFLTGEEDEIKHVVRDGFHVHAEPTRWFRRTPGNEFTHSTRLLLVDREGRLHGTYLGLPPTDLEGGRDLFDQDMRQLESDVRTLHAARSRRVVDGPDYPLLNATLNAICMVLLLSGLMAIRLRQPRIHATFMLSALAVSAVFLTSYLYYHLAIMKGESTRFQDQAPGAPDGVRYVYYAILLTHVVLAAIVPVLALFTAYQGLTGNLARHVRIARWTMPIWLYVSVTGVVVYWMLYRMYIE